MKEEQPYIPNIPIESTQRYVKLTRALILQRLLLGQLDLEASQRARMEAQLANIRLSLKLSENDFKKALLDITDSKDSKGSSSSSSSSVLASPESLGGFKNSDVKQAYCLSRKCRHQFTVDMALTGLKKCPACGGPAMFMVGGEPEGKT